MSKDNNNDMVNSILDTSSMSYGLPPMPSLAVARRIIDSHPQTTSASNSGSLIFTLNTGDMFLLGKTSYMSVRLTTVGGDANTKLTSSGVLGLFSSIVVSARNGVEVCRLTEPGLFSKKEKWTMTHDKHQLIYQAGGEDHKIGADADIMLVFRMDSIPFFNQENLLPSMVCEGLRVHFTLNTPARTFYSATDVASFSVTPIMKLDAVTLADQFLRAVSVNSSNEGLVLLHSEYFHSQNSSNISAVNFNINKSCSKATSFMMVSRNSANVDDKTVDNYLSNAYDFNRIQLQAGSVFYPNSPLEQKSSADSRETYHYVLTNLAPDYNCSVHHDKFNIPGPAVFGQNLKENNRGQLTGILLNNSRSLLVSATMDSATSRIFNSYLEHVRLVRVFSNNVVVRD